MALFLVSWYSVFQIAGNTSGNLSLQSQYLPDHSKELGMKIYVLCKHCNSCTVLTCRNEACTQQTNYTSVSVALTFHLT